jgi:hypothetical protein
MSYTGMQQTQNRDGENVTHFKGSVSAYDRLFDNYCVTIKFISRVLAA